MSHAIRARVYESAQEFELRSVLWDDDPTEVEAPLFLSHHERLQCSPLMHDAFDDGDTTVFLCPEDAVCGTGIPAYDLGGEG